MVSIKRVLVVDDEPEIRALLAEALARQGHRADTAGDGFEAVRKLKEGSYSAVVTDVNMPGMDGIELLRWMKRNRRSEKVVVMSGSPRHDVLPGRGLPSVKAQFRKPFRLQAFMRTMGAILDDEKADRRGIESREMGAA